MLSHHALTKPRQGAMKKKKKSDTPRSSSRGEGGRGEKQGILRLSPHKIVCARWDSRVSGTIDVNVTPQPSCAHESVKG